MLHHDILEAAKLQSDAQLEPARELGLRINDKNIIEDLINRFDNALGLEDRNSLNYHQATREYYKRQIERPILKP